MPRPRKGDHVRYTGPYAPEVGAAAAYPPGVIVGFRNYGQTVTVALDGEDTYADWPADQIEEV